MRASPGLFVAVAARLLRMWFAARVLLYVRTSSSGVRLHVRQVVHARQDVCTRTCVAPDGAFQMYRRMFIKGMFSSALMICRPGRLKLPPVRACDTRGLNMAGLLARLLQTEQKTGMFRL